MINYTDGAKKLAEEKGLYLVKILLDGRYLKKGQTEMSGPVGPETAKKLIDLFNLLLDSKERMK